MKFVPFDLAKLGEAKSYVCKKKNNYCKCIKCKFCGEILMKNDECKYCKKRNKIKNFAITNAELNALEDLGITDLKFMFQEKREKEVEVWQTRCRSVWHRFVKKIDKGS